MCKPGSRRSRPGLSASSLAAHDSWTSINFCRTALGLSASTARAGRIYKTYGIDAVQVMSESPSHLARDIRGIGFKTADAIARKRGIDNTAIIWVRARISYALTEAMDEGHCGLPAEQLVPLAGEATGSRR